jgi:glucokinase
VSWRQVDPWPAAPDRWCLAVDVGATKLAVGLVSGSGAILAAQRVPTPSSPAGDPEPGLRALFGVVDQVCRIARTEGLTLLACGVGSGGPMDEERRVSPLHIPGWRDLPIGPLLAERTGLATFVDNDAKALVLGEWWWGAGRGYRNLLGMVVSSGIGAGLVVDGRLLDGASGNAGHLGHLVVVPEGRPCACGNRGCVEAETSGLAIAARTGRPPAEAPPEVRWRAGALVGQAVASAVVLLDLSLAVVGGSVALGFGGPFFQAANAALARHAPIGYARAARVVPVGQGPDAPLAGAGALAWRGLLGVEQPPPTLEHSTAPSDPGPSDSGGSWSAQDRPAARPQG